MASANPPPQSVLVKLYSAVPCVKDASIDMNPVIAPSTPDKIIYFPRKSSIQKVAIKPTKLSIEFV